jgi:DNA-binding transcriptional LysR family regulator
MMAMAKLDLESLGVFVEIYKTQSVSRAAERLGIAQSTASIALNKLRHHFGDPLFCRTSRGMEPTPRAQSIHPELRNALESVERARGARSAFSAADAERAFCICVTDISEIVLLPRLLNHLKQHAPHISIETERISTDTPRRLESGEVDLAVGFLPALDAGFYQQTLFDENFVCLAAADHPRIQGKVTKRAFCAEGHIVVSTTGTGHSIVDKTLVQHGVERRVMLRLSSFLGVARVVAQSELLVIVPSRLGDALAAQEHVQVLAPATPLPTFQVKQHWHERFHADAGNVWLRRTMAELFIARAAPQRRGATAG